MFVVPITIFILFLTIVGLPLAILLLLLWIAAALLSMPLAAYFGASVFLSRLHPVLVVLIGSVVLGLIELIPVAGWIVGLIAYWLGTGVLLRGLRRDYPRPVYAAK
jgi:hypothetical protein